MLKRVDKKKVLFIFAVIVITFPFVITMLFASASTDDFSMASNVHQGTSIVLESLRIGWWYYMNWGPSFPVFALQILLNPLVLFGPDSYGYGIILIGIFIILIVVLYFYIQEILALCVDGCNDSIIRIVYLLMLVSFLNAGIFSEIYYWFIGSIAYIIPLIFTLLNQILIFKYFKNGSFKYALLLCIFGFLGSINYMLDVFSGIIYVYLFIANIIDEKRASIKRIIPLLFMILGGVVSAFSPGNMARSTTVQNTITLEKFLAITVSNVLNVIIKSFTNPYFIILLIGMFFIGRNYRINRYVTGETKFILFVLGMILSLFGMMTPLILGYKNDTIPERIYVFINIIIYTWSLVIMLNIGGMSKGLLQGANDKSLHNQNTILIIAVLMILIVSGKLGTSGWINMEHPWAYTAANVYNCYQEGKYNKEIASELYYSQEDDVEIVKEELTIHTGIIKPIELTDDSTFWHNVDTASWARKNSVKFYIQ